MKKDAHNISLAYSNTILLSKSKLIVVNLELQKGFFKLFIEQFTSKSNQEPDTDNCKILMFLLNTVYSHTFISFFVFSIICDNYCY